MLPKIGIYGLGSIGCMIASSLLGHGYEVVVAIDRDPKKVGVDLGVLSGRTPLGTIVTEDLDTGVDCDVFIHSTTSKFKDVYPQIAEIVETGTHVISTCEELSCPELKSPELAVALDGLCRDRGVAVLGTGVNPGFLLDAFPAFVAGVSLGVDSISANRIVDVARRREPLQRKVGLGMGPDALTQQAKRGAMGHVGLGESVALIAMAMGWDISEIRQEIAPVVAEEDLKTGFFTVRKGEVAGLRQEARGSGDGHTIQLNLDMSVAPDQPGDSVHILGKPEIDLLINGGVDGDLATVARVINHIPGVVRAPPGLATVLDIPISRRRATLGAPSLTGNASLL